MDRFQMYIDGRYTDAASGEWFDTHNPYTGAVWAQVAKGGPDDVEQRGVEFVESLGHGPMVAVDEEIRALIESLELPVQGGPTYAAVSEGTQFT